MTDSGWTTRAADPADFDAWRELFAGYCAFYACPTSDEHQRLVWSWIQDAGSVHALLAVPAGGGDPAGLAHLRPWVRPLRGQVCGYLDDLFVAPAARGTGAADALFDGIDALARAEGWAIVRWMTAADNHRAQALYDRRAVRTPWVTYDMTAALSA